MVVLLRILAFFACRVPGDLFIFVFRALFLVPHDTGKREIRHLQQGAGLVCLQRRGAPILGFGVSAAIDAGELKLVLNRIE
jgi:hypothetical protein